MQPLIHRGSGLSQYDYNLFGTNLIRMDDMGGETRLSALRHDHLQGDILVKPGVIQYWMAESIVISSELQNVKIIIFAYFFNISSINFK